MKKSKLILFSLLLTFISLMPLEAASFSMTSSKKQVSPNGTFTVSVGGDCIGRVNLTISNGTLNESSIWVEQGYTKVTVKAGSSGTVTITATPETGFSDPEANTYNPGSRTINVSIVSSSSSGSTQTTKKSNVNDLISLTTSLGELSPTFNSSNTEYILELPQDSKTISLNATAKDNKAKIDGLGEKQLNPGNNIINITVTAENGEKKIYTIKIHVDESPQVYLEYNDNKIGIIRNYEGLTIPENFKEIEHKVNEKDIKIFTNEKIDIIYGINEENEKNIYLFDKENNKIKSKLKQITINNRTLFVTDTKIKKANTKLEIIKINETEIECYKYESENYCILNAINETGNSKDYLYEISENTIQLYPSFLIKKSKVNLIMYILGGTALILLIIIAFLILKLKGGVTNEKTK